MRKLLSLLIIFIPLLALANTPARPTLSFDGVEYQLVYATEKPHFSINEYLPAGQNLDSWTEMLAVHKTILPKDVTAEEFARFTAAQLKKANPNASGKIEGNRKTQEAMIQFFAAAAAPKKVIEFNIFRYKKDTAPNTILTYQFAVRHYPQQGVDEKAFFEKVKEGELRWKALLFEAPYPTFISEKNFQAMGTQ